MAVRLRPQQEGGSDSTSGTCNDGSSSEDQGSLEEGFLLPAFRFERQGLAIDEYHARADAPYEEELAKRVEAALSLSRPEDASELLPSLW